MFDERIYSCLLPSCGIVPLTSANKALPARKQNITCRQNRVFLMNLLNINLIRKKSQQFYKIIPNFYQSAPCMIVRRVLVLITNRRRGSLPLSRSANLPRFVLRLLFQFLQLFSPSLFFAFVSRRISDCSDTQTLFFLKVKVRNRVTVTRRALVFFIFQDQARRRQR